MAVNLDEIDVQDYEFSGEEIGELLLKSIQQAKDGQIAKTREVIVKNRGCTP